MSAARSVDVALATAAQMPKPDPESHLLVDALAALGVAAAMQPWDEPADWERFPLVVSRTPWDYFHRAEEFMAWVGHVAACTQLQNPAEVIVWNGHKSYLLDLDRAGVPVVPTALVERGCDDAVQEAALDGHGEVVVKPAVSGGAIGALQASASEERTREHLRELAAGGDVLVQPFLESVARRGEASLIFFDGLLSHAVRKVPADGDYRVQELYGGSLHAHEPSGEELAIAEAALAAAPAATAYARIDLVEGDAGPLLMEAELIEPELFLPLDPEAAGRFATCLVRRLGSG